MTSDPALSSRGMPQVAVIIPHYDDIPRLRRCLAALVGQNCKDIEIIVADNGTLAGLGGVQAEYPDIHFVVQPERGAAAARNAGVAASTAPWVAFLDADCVPAANWLSRVRDIAVGPKDMITGGRVAVFDETPPPRSGAEAFETVFAFDQKDYVERKGFSVTANLVASRATVEAVGPFKPGISEDLEWCRRAAARGHILRYDSCLSVAHPTRSDWPALRRKWLRLTEESFALIRKRRLGHIRWALKALLMPPSVVAHGIRVLRHPSLSTAERGRAFATLAKLRLRRMVWMLGQAVGLPPK
jgi:glycosyltransferase involved in cell wall biosynthesis